MACVYTKQFSDTPSNPNKVVGQIMKTSSGKPLFQIIAVTEDMELAGKTKNALLKMGYDDSKEEVKTFAKGNTFAIFDKNEKVLDIDGDWVDFRATDPHDIEYFDDYNDAVKRAMEVEGTVEGIK